MQFRYKKRYIVEGGDACYHVITRTIGDAFLFKDREKEVFRKMLRKQAAFAGVQVLTYVIMSNHVHLLVRVPYRSSESIDDAELLRRYRELYGEHVPGGAYSPEELEKELQNGGAVAERLRARLKSRMGDLAMFMQELKQRFTRWYHHLHGGHGTIWAEAYKALLVQDDPYVLKVVAAYIDLNPVRAELANEPSEYRFCGYSEALGGGAQARNGIISVCGYKSWEDSLSGYQLFLYEKGRTDKGAVDGKDEGRIPEEAVDRVKASGGKLTVAEALRYRIRYFQDGVALGNESFVESIFSSARERFGAKRQTGARVLRAFPKEEPLRVLRDLQS